MRHMRQRHQPGGRLSQWTTPDSRPTLAVTAALYGSESRSGPPAASRRFDGVGADLWRSLAARRLRTVASSHTSTAELWVQRNLAAGIFTLFAAGAGLAQATNGPLWLKLVFAAIALVGAVVALVLLRERKAQREDTERQRATETRTRSAVGLHLSRFQGLPPYLGLSNRARHVIRDSMVVAVPQDEGWTWETHGLLPSMYEGAPGVVLDRQVTGGWFIAQIAQLDPGRSVEVVRFEDDPDDDKRLQLDVWWNDHEGLRRRAQVIANISGPDGRLDLRYHDLDESGDWA